jgi:putative ABC transport system substrate-binding protein
MHLEVIEVRTPNDLVGAFDEMVQKGFGGVIMQPDPMLYNERKTIAELALTRHIATMGHVGQMSKDGMLLSYGTNYPTMFRRVGMYVEKILKGDKPGDLPVEQPTKFELIVNLKTARALGVTVPQSLLVAADDVIA